MSENASELSLDAVVERLNLLIEGTEQNRVAAERLEHSKQRALKAISNRFDPQIQKHRDAIRTATDEVHKLCDEHGGRLFKPGTKEIHLRAGVIKEYFGPEKLVIDADKADVLKQLRQLRIFRRFTTPKDPDINTKELKKAPQIVSKLRGVRITRDKFRRIVPAQAQSESVIKNDPYTRTLPEEEN